MYLSSQFSLSFCHNYFIFFDNVWKLLKIKTWLGFMISYLHTVTFIHWDKINFTANLLLL